MITYVSGPMTGLEDLNFPAFYAAQELLESQGHTCVNPAEVGKQLVIPDGLSKGDLYLFCLRADIAEMINRDCNTIYMLKDWETSRGANTELNTAVSLGFKVIYEPGCEFHLCGCQGGISFILHNTGEDYREHYQSYEVCDRCKGTRIVPAIEAEWRKAGKILRSKRIGMDMTLSGFKEKYGVSLVALSAAENGRVDPAEYLEMMG